MKRKIMLKTILTAMVLTLGISISSYAQETEEDIMLQESVEEAENIEEAENAEEEQIAGEEAENIEEEQIAGEEAANAIQPQAAFTLTTDFPSVIKCKEEITFTMNASGGSGNYGYRVYNVEMLDPSGRVTIYDTTFNAANLQFKDSNLFKITFHVPGTYYIKFSVMDKGTKATVHSPLYTINIQDDRYPSVEQIIDEVTAECEKSCTTDFEKALWLHDWLLEHADYDYSLSFCAAEGVLARGIGTCESYHRAYEMLLNKVGIQTGRTISASHVWTAVKMDGDWYQVDCTWDDQGPSYKGKYNEHLYFGLTDELIGIAGEAHKVYKYTPGCESTSLENNYFIKTGKISQWSDPLIPLIKQRIADGERDFMVSTPPSGTLLSYDREIIYTLVAYQLTRQVWDGVEMTVSYSGSDDAMVIKAEDVTSYPEVVPITSVTLNKKSATLYPGQTIALTAAIQPQNTTESKKLTWTSSNKAVATVDSSGKVKAVKPGSATITAKSGNGKKASCSVNVVNQASTGNTGNTGWKKDSAGYWYRNPDGTYPRNQWKAIDGAWYYFDPSGYRVTGWKMLGGAWYFMQSDGKMVTGARTIGGKEYYFTSGGVMVKGWQKRNGSWYYYSASGAMVKSAWQQLGGAWYFMQSDGKMVTGARTIGGKEYYFTSGGAMAKGWQSRNGSWYYYSASGAMVKGAWQQLGGAWYFMQSDGKMVTGARTIGGKEYYFTSGGVMVKGWQSRNGSWYYYSSGGAMVKGAWQIIGGSWYYLKKDGKMAANEWIGSHYVNASGKWV